MTQTARIGVVVGVAVAGAVLAFVAWFARPSAPSAPSETPVAIAVSSAANAANAARNVDESAPVTPPTPVARRVVSGPPPGSSQPPRDGDTLVVRVVDFDGQPLAGVPVSIRLSAIDLRRRRVEALATTAGVHGECVVPQFAQHVASIGVPPAERSNVVELLAHGPGWESPGVFVDATQLPAAPIVLRAPPHGSVRVRLRDPSRVPDQQVVHATLETHPLTADREQRARQSRRERLSAETHECVIAPVGLGRSVRVSVAAWGPTFPRATDVRSACDVVDVVGPVRPGEIVDVVLDVAPSGARVVGRLIADGTLLSHRDVRVMVFVESRISMVMFHLGARDGRFEFALPRTAAGSRIQIHARSEIEGVVHEAVRTREVTVAPDATIDFGELMLVRGGVGSFSFRTADPIRTDFLRPLR
jgi:hypothetical protein